MSRSPAPELLDLLVSDGTRQPPSAAPCARAAHRPRPASLLGCLPAGCERPKLTLFAAPAAGGRGLLPRGKSLNANRNGAARAFCSEAGEGNGARAIGSGAAGKRAPVARLAGRSARRRLHD